MPSGEHRGIWRGLTACLLVVAGLGGCATSLPRQTPSNALAAAHAVVPGIPNARFWGDEVPADLGHAIETRLPSLKRLASAAKIVGGRPHVHILALSGGGPGGAFGAGLLKGWSQQGTRPRFDVVTGVSAGAIIAPFAFLGPAYDHQLEQIWTQYETSELIVAQILPAILGGPALADTGPLEKLIERYVDRRLLSAVAAEHRQGRMLLIGTTNLDAQRPVYWNMGEIAASSRPKALELFRKVIMASAAIPGAFPPVSIDVQSEGRMVEEMHVDGGTTRDVFVAPLQLKLSDLDRLYTVPPKRHIYIIMNAKMGPEFQPVKATAVAIGARAIATLIQSHDRGDLQLIAQQARESGATFSFASIPASFTLVPKEAFDPVYQQALYDAGKAMGQTGGGWRERLVERPMPGAAR